MSTRSGTETLPKRRASRRSSQEVLSSPAPNVSPVDDWMTTGEAGKRLGVTDRRVLQFVEEKRLRSQKAGRIHLIRYEDVERLAAELIEQASTSKRGPKPNVVQRQEKSE